MGKLKEIDENLINTPIGDKQYTPIIIACLEGNEQAVVELMELGADLSARAKDGFTALIAAAFSDMTRIIDRLLKCESIAVNAQDDEGYTALHFATRNNNHTAVEALLGKGADPTITSYQQRFTPVHGTAIGDAASALCKIAKAYPSLNLDVRCQSGWNPLHLAAPKNVFKTVEALIDLGCPLNEVDDSGRTALHIAAWQNALETVNLLLLARCDVSKVTSRGNTALHIAAEHGYESIVSSFLRHLKSVDLDVLLRIANNSKSMALHLACQAGCTKSVEGLIHAGADVMIGDLYNYSEQRSIHGGCFRTSTQNMDSICETHRCSGDLPPLPDGLQGSIMFTFWSNLF